MKKIMWFALLLPSPLFAWNIMDLWQTPDQQAMKLLQSGKAQAAAQVFQDKDWQAVAAYRANNYEQAFKQFNTKNTSDSQYNAGNAAAFAGRYQEAIKSYDKAIALNPNNQDAATNREIVKKILEKKKKEEQKNSDKNNESNDKDSSQNDNAKKKPSENNEKKQQQNGQRNSQDKNNQQPQPMTPTPQAANPNQQNETAAAASQSSNKDDSKNQILRRLSDDPGGLLRQKFLRDYFRRHANENSIPDLGDSNAF